MSSVKPSAVLHDLWVQACQFQDWQIRYECLGEIALSLNFVGDTASCCKLWEHELQWVAGLCDESLQAEALASIAQYLGDLSLGQESQLLWWQILSLTESFQDQALRDWGLAELSFQLVQKPDLPATLPILQYLVTFKTASLSGSDILPSLIFSLLTCLADAAKHPGLHLLWRVAESLIEETSDLLDRVVFLSAFSASLSQAGRSDQAGAVFARVLASCEQMGPTQTVLVLPRMIPDLVIASRDDSRLLLALAEQIAKIGSDTVQEMLLNLLVTSLAQKGKFGPQDMVWSGLQALYAGLDDPLARIQGWMALAVAWSKAGGQQAALDLSRTVLDQLTLLPKDFSRRKALYQVGRYLAQLDASAERQDLWETIQDLTDQADHWAKFVFWQALCLARTGQDASAQVLFDRLIVACDILVQPVQKVAFLQVVMEEIHQIQKKPQYSKYIYYFIIIIEKFHQQVRGYKDMLFLKPFFMALVQSCSDRLLLAGLQALLDESNLAEVLKEIMQELIQTRSLGQFPLAFYQDCEDVADRIQAFVSQIRALLWVAVGLADQLPRRAEQILTQAQQLAAVLPAGSLQTQLLTETLICLGLCSGQIKSDALWDTLGAQIQAKADRDTRLRLSLCLVGGLAMARKYPEAVAEMSQIPSVAIQAQALKSIAQVIRGAGGR